MASRSLSLPIRHRWRMSCYFMPRKGDPKYHPKTQRAQNHLVQNGDTAELVSHRLLLDLGFIKPADKAPGMYHYLPMAMRSMDKLMGLIDAVMMKYDCQKVQLPTLTSSHLWEKSERLDSMGKELMKVKDRRDREFVLSPTHEEVITRMIGSGPPLPRKELPVKLYQITPKIRDEMRCKFGLIRSREFIMKDLYTFDLSQENAMETYETMNEAYNEFFQLLNVPFVKVVGKSGNMGGDLSHEYQLPSKIGQDNLLICGACHRGKNAEVSTSLSDPTCDQCKGTHLWQQHKGIEVGHTFYLGRRYSQSLGAMVNPGNGKPIPAEMGCYGLGVSRIFAASLEVLQTCPTKLSWPKLIAPFTLVILAPKKGSKEYAHFQDILEFYDDVNSRLLPNDVMLDDRDNLTIGRKLDEAKTIGFPYIVVFGKTFFNADNPELELYSAETDTTMMLSPEAVKNFLNRANSERCPNLSL
ncbi:probable proline--tRNA ligase, mitochondrial [Tigriopus californicus]|uniref:probable proline--tRNA ligase, mitochondrial n=1 Tax=Tigriopus californicus TaxID=6832 RepID=UPI0027DA9578|nr:probable proline--tRNA ligase, mitochondrial [Tigriopus californicus]